MITIHQCIHCGEYAIKRDRCGWCDQCARDLAYGRNGFSHLPPPTAEEIQGEARYHAGRIWQIVEGG